MVPAHSVAGRHAPVSWKRRWIDWRNRVLASAGFQAWAGRWPLVRRIARQRAAGLFDLMAGFTYSQICLAAVESGLLDLLAAGPLGAENLAQSARLSDAAADRLLRAATAIGLAEELSTGWWMLGQQGAVLQADRGMQAMVRHHRALYADLADPLALLRADRGEPTRLAAFWEYSGEVAAPAYSALMASTQQMVAAQVLSACNLARHSSLLDIGGGHGSFVAAVARRHPGMRLGVFDLPAVLAGTANLQARSQLPGRVALHPGNFFTDSLPRGYDCISLVRILHDHDDAECRKLLRAIRAALPPRGTLLIAEPMARTKGAEPMGDGYFGLYLWAMGRGRPRSAGELRTLLAEAGFSSARSVPTDQPVVTSLIVAQA